MMSNKYFYLFYVISSIFIMIYAFRKDRKQLKMSWDGLAKFTGFMALLTMYRLCMFDTFTSIDEFHRFPIKMWQFMLVFLEDAFFVMIPYYLTRNRQSKIFKYIVWGCFSVLFASGHLYQGLFVAAVTGVYPYFISRKYALKSSFLTVMACHFMYDCFTFVTLKFAQILHVFKMYL
jgi:hypothetical protein